MISKCFDLRFTFAKQNTMKKVFLSALAAATILASCSKTEGCMDETANNYNAEAEVQGDAVCTYDTQLGENEWQDPRDGKIYQTVEINGVTWMAENLAYAHDSAVAPNGDMANVAEYGYLYSYTEAQESVPSGWRLATVSDWDNLISFVTNDATELEVGGTTGFNLKYAGGQFLFNGAFYSFDSQAVFDSYSTTTDYGQVQIQSDTREITTLNPISVQSVRSSVRLIQN